MKNFLLAATTALTSSLALSAAAQSVATQSIDEALDGQLDFRRTAYAVCIDLPTCEVAGVTVTAERQVGDGDVWVPATLYWDPVDGFGVQGGNQNDEIDVDERLVVEFSSPVQTRGIWLSDVFISEAGRYQTVNANAEDAEVADFEMFRGNAPVLQARMSGQIDLPRDPFNGLFPEAFVEDGDLLNRLLIGTDNISIYMPDPDGTGVVTLPLGDIDREKQAIFAGVETVDIPIAELLGGATNITVFKAGSENAARILAARDNLASLEKLRIDATNARRVGSIPNGEIGWYSGNGIAVDRIVFTSEPLTSNDYSIAGIVIQ